MTQTSNREAFTPWGEPVQPVTGSSWWSPLVTLPALLGHVVVMLTVMAALTALNLAFNPGTWWSLAILVLWLTVVLVHVLARYALGFLLEEDRNDEAAPPRVDVEPHGATVHGPAVPNGRRQGRHDDAPISWELKSDDVISSAWPKQGPEVAPPPPAETAPESGNGSGERVPWRAATDIAWLRRHRTGGAEASGANEEASQ